MKRLEVTFVAILFYVGWFSCAFLAKSTFSSASLAFPFFLIVFLLWTNSLTKAGIIAASLISIFGSLFDFFAIRLGFVAATGEAVALVPIWLVSLWLLFSFTMIRLGPILDLPAWLAVILGAIFGPLSYKSGELFQIFMFSSSFSILIYALFWGAAFPLVLNLSKRTV